MQGGGDLYIASATRVERARERRGQAGRAARGSRSWMQEREAVDTQGRRRWAREKVWRVANARIAVSHEATDDADIRSVGPNLNGLRLAPGAAPGHVLLHLMVEQKSSGKLLL